MSAKILPFSIKRNTTKEPVTCRVCGRVDREGYFNATDERSGVRVSGPYCENCWMPIEGFIMDVYKVKTLQYQLLEISVLPATEAPDETL